MSVVRKVLVTATNQVIFRLARQLISRQGRDQGFLLSSTGSATSPHLSPCEYLGVVFLISWYFEMHILIFWGVYWFVQMLRCIFIYWYFEMLINLLIFQNTYFSIGILRCILFCWNFEIHINLLVFWDANFSVDMHINLLIF